MEGSRNFYFLMSEDMPVGLRAPSLRLTNQALICLGYRQSKTMLSFKMSGVYKSKA